MATGSTSMSLNRAPQHPESTTAPVSGHWKTRFRVAYEQQRTQSLTIGAIAPDPMPTPSQTVSPSRRLERTPPSTERIFSETGTQTDSVLTGGPVSIGVQFHDGSAVNNSARLHAAPTTGSSIGNGSAQCASCGAGTAFSQPNGVSSAAICASRPGNATGSGSSNIPTPGSCSTAIISNSAPALPESSTSHQMPGMLSRTCDDHVTPTATFDTGGDEEDMDISREPSPTRSLSPMPEIFSSGSLRPSVMLSPSPTATELVANTPASGRSAPSASSSGSPVHAMDVDEPLFVSNGPKSLGERRKAQDGPNRRFDVQTPVADAARSVNALRINAQALSKLSIPTASSQLPLRPNISENAHTLPSRPIVPQRVNIPLGSVVPAPRLPPRPPGAQQTNIKEAAKPVSNLAGHTLGASSSATRLPGIETAISSTSRNNPEPAENAPTRGRPLERRQPLPAINPSTSGYGDRADLTAASTPNPGPPPTSHRRSRSRSSSAFSYSRPIRSTSDAREPVNAEPFSPKRRRSPSNRSWRDGPSCEYRSQQWSPPDRRRRSWSRGSRGGSRSPSPRRFHRLPRGPSPPFQEPLSPYRGDHWERDAHSPRRDRLLRAISPIYPQRPFSRMPLASDHWESSLQDEPDGQRVRQRRPRKLPRAERWARANAAALSRP